MPADSGLPPGTRFASDLRHIREARGITLADLQNETKIPTNLLEAFEQSGLFDHPMFNRVYLRSFVRTYAEVVRISPDVALKALEEALDGTYDGRLAELAGAPPPAEPKTRKRVVIEDEPAFVRPTAPPAAATPPAVAPPPVHVQAPSPGPAAPAGPGMGAAPPARFPAPVDIYDRRQRNVWPWVLSLGALAVVGVILWLVLGRSKPTDSDAAAPVASGPAQVDTTAQREPPAQAQPAVALPDTVRVTLVGDPGPVEGVRVTVDADMRRPYWLEKGQSRTFRMTQRMVIERQLTRLQVQVQGRPYPEAPLDTLGRLVITRASVQRFLRQQP